MTRAPEAMRGATRTCVVLAALLAVACPRTAFPLPSGEGQGEGSGKPHTPGASPASDREGKPLVVILPLGKVDAQTLKDVAAAVGDAAQVRTRIDPKRPLPKSAWYEPRKRWRAEKLLASIDADPPEGAWKVVAVTEAEISTTKGDIDDWGIGGLGNIGERSCVVSTYLLRKHTKSSEPKKLAERTRKLAIHELGHTLGLDHCEVFGCVMSDAQGKLIRSLDSTGEAYCGRCRKKLPTEWLTPK